MSKYLTEKEAYDLWYKEYSDICPFKDYKEEDFFAIAPELGINIITDEDINENMNNYYMGGELDV